MSAKGIIVAVCGEKGGIAKTTTATTIAYDLARKGQRVLCIDMDPQGAMSSIMGAAEDDAGILDVLAGENAAADLIQSFDYGNGSIGILGANAALSQAEATCDMRPTILAEAIEPVLKDYDLVVIDTSPQPKTKAIVAALTAADHVVLPVLAEPKPTESLAKMAAVVERVKGAEALARTHVVITRHQPFVNVYREMATAIETFCEAKGIGLLGTVRNSCSVVESQALRIPLSDHKRLSLAACEYREVADKLAGEVL